jgi:heat-inducible transcriptional repressor
MDLSARQREILMAIIQEFMKTAGEVGSSLLLEHYDLGVSPATIRNEMVKLMQAGFLDKSHVSSGRLPTDQAIRFYVKNLIKDEILGTVELIDIKQGIFSVRFDQEMLMRVILETLSKHCNAASFVVLDDMTRYYGVSSLMSYEELRNIDVLQRILDLLEDKTMLSRLFTNVQDDDVTILIGNESGISDLGNCAMIFVRFNFWGNRKGFMGVIGSRRLNYKHVIPVIKSIKAAVEESLKGWS